MAALDLGGEPTAADHTDLFVLELPPYASIYLGAEGQIGGQARERVAGFWRAVGRLPPPEPDHLVALLGMWAALDDDQTRAEEPARRTLAAHASRALVAEHLAPWLGPYLLRVVDLGAPPYRRWAEILLSLLADAMPDDIPAESVPVPADPVRRLLTPAHAGLILTRSDLRQCAAATGLGHRIGERAFALRSLIDQDAAAVTRWLAAVASDWADRLAAAGPVVAPAWCVRARDTAAWLSQGAL